MRSLKIALCITLFFASPHETLSQTAETAAIQEEAERDLRDIDCEIASFALEAERLEGVLKMNLERVRAPIREAFAASDAAREQAVKMRIDSVLMLPDAAMEDMRDNSIMELGKRYLKGQARRRFIKAFTGLGVLKTYGGIIGKVVDMRDLLLAAMKNADAERKMLKAMDDLDEARREAESVERLMTTLLERRETAVGIWTSKGAALEEVDFSDDCAPESNSFDGTWHRVTNPDGNVITIDGNAFSITMRFDGQQACTIKGQVVEHGKNDILGTWNSPCLDLKVVGGFAMHREGGVISYSECSQFSWAGNAPSSCGLQYEEVERE